MANWARRHGALAAARVHQRDLRQHTAERDAGNSGAFVAKYRELLCAGGTERYDVALARFGLDARDPSFWSMGLDMISGMIDELEGLS